MGTNHLYSCAQSLIICIVITIAFCNAQAKPTRFEKLIDAQRKSSIIELNNEDLKSYASFKSNYTMILLFTSKNPQISDVSAADQTNSAYQQAADAFFQSLGPERINSEQWQQNPVFFARCDVENCREVFVDGTKKAGWRAVPKVFCLTPRSGKGLNLGSWEDMSQEPVRASGADIAAWISHKTRYPLFLEKSFFAKYGTGLMNMAVFAVVVYLLAPRIQRAISNTMFWFVLSLGVYAFTMAGVVFNAIHPEVGFSYKHPQSGQTYYIYPSARTQFVAEGYIMAVLLTGTGLLFVLFSAWVPTLKTPWAKRAGFAVLGLSFLLSHSQVMNIFRSKYGFYPF